MNRYSLHFNKIVVFLALFFIPAYAAHAQVITYSQSFTQSATAPQATCDAWNTFRSQLLVYPYLSMSVTAGSPSTAITCTNTAVVAAVAAALRTGTSGTWTDGSYTWNVGSCGSTSSGTGWELSVNNSGNCQCGTGWAVRPCIGNSNWGGYGTTCTGPSQIMTVVFNAVPPCPAKIVAAPLHMSLCETDSTVFFAVADSAQTYRWQMNTGAGWVNMIDGVNFSGTSTDTLRVKNTTMAMNKYKFRMIATNIAKSCSVTSDSGVLTMIPGTNASVIVTVAPDTNMCQGDEITFQTAFTNGGATPQYRWMLNGKTITGEANASLKIKTLKDGDYIQCRFISSGQCVFPVTSDPISFKVSDLVTPAVSVKVDNNMDGTYTFTAMPQNGGAQPQYFWFVNNKMVVGQNGSNFTSGDLYSFDKVTVEMISDLPCAAPKNVRSDFRTTSVEGMNGAGLVSLKPNPNKGIFTLSTGRMPGTSATISITNALGQSVFNKQIANTPNGFSEVVDLGSGLPGGLYILTFHAGEIKEKLTFTISK